MHLQLEERGVHVVDATSLARVPTIHRFRRAVGVRDMASTTSARAWLRHHQWYTAGKGLRKSAEVAVHGV